MKTQSNRIAIAAATLAWCNERRAELGKGPPLRKLPRGIANDGYSCPCAKATGIFVGFTSWATSRRRPPRGDLPILVCEFIRLLDTGAFPEYEEKSR